MSAVEKTGIAEDIQDSGVIERFNELLNMFETREEASRVSGKSVDQLRNYSKGSNLAFEPLVRMCDAKNVRLDWIRSGVGPKHLQLDGSNLLDQLRDMVGSYGLPWNENMKQFLASIDWSEFSEHPGGSEVRDEEFAYIPLFDVQFSAGPGSFPGEDTILKKYAFRRDFLIAENLNPEKLCLVKSSGDSMEDTIMDKQLVMVNRAVQRWDGDGIYVFQRDSFLFIKRVEMTAEGVYRVSSDNPRYESMEYEVDKMALMFFGKAVPMGRLFW